MGCSKFLVVTLTTLILLSGLALLGYGVWHIIQAKGFSVTGSQVLDIALVSVAGVLAFIGFVGVIGICCHSKCWLKLYFVLVLLILVAKIGLVVYAAVNEKGFEKLVSSGWGKLKDEQRIEMQNKMRCCGMGTLDPSLSSSNDSSCFQSGTINSVRYDDCFTSVKLLIKTHIYLFAGVCGGLAFIELLLLFCLPCVISRIGDGSEADVRHTKVRPMPLPANRSNQSTINYQRPNQQTLDQSTLNAQRQAAEYKQRQTVVMQMQAQNGGAHTHQRGINT